LPLFYPLAALKRNEIPYDFQTELLLLNFIRYNVSRGSALKAPPQSSPWNYTGGFSIVPSLLDSWGNVTSFDGYAFSSLTASSSMSQMMKGLIPGRKYFVSWIQMLSPTSTQPIGLTVSVGAAVLYMESNVSNTIQWNFRTSNVFTASSKDMALDFSTFSNNPDESSAIALDHIEVNVYFNIMGKFYNLFFQFH
jgi:hypothetical protein